MDEKQIAAESAAELVKNGMVIGLGSGSTAEMAICIIGERVKNGLQVLVVDLFLETQEIARRLGLWIHGRDGHLHYRRESEKRPAGYRRTHFSQIRGNRSRVGSAVSDA